MFEHEAKAQAERRKRDERNRAARERRAAKREEPELDVQESPYERDVADRIDGYNLDNLGESPDY